MIEKSRIYVGTVEKLISKLKKDNKSADKALLVDEISKKENVVLIAFDTNKGLRYVPLFYANNLFRFISVSLAAKELVPSDRFISKISEMDNIGQPYKLRTWISKCERLFTDEGKTSLKELISIQNSLFGIDDQKAILF